LKAGFLRRNGIAHSDRARMLEYFVRHDDYLTLVTAVDDPLYLDEPFVRSTDFRLDPRANTRLAEFGGFANGGDGEGFGASDVFYKCAPTEEIAIDRGRVPSYMPGANDNLDMFAQRHGVPLAAALGGSATLYPEFAERLHAGGGEIAGEARAARSRRSPEPPAPATAVATEVTSLHVAGQVWLVTAGDRNVAVQVGDEGVLVVNPGPEQLADAVLAEIHELAPDKRVRVVILTDDDARHIGGTEKLAAGPTPDAQRAAVFAHENTALRIAAGPFADRHSPTDTFFRGTRELYFNGEPIEIIHAPGATSDGDLLVFFRKSDVVVTGGVIADLTYPVVRLNDGGTVNGTLEALNDILDITIAEWRAQGGTMVVPDRGRIYDEGDVAEYRDMLTIIRDRVQDAIDKGLTLDQIKAARLARDYDGRYGAESGPVFAEEFMTTMYLSLTAPSN
jgi:glyoxylase-like metal-dependent hydrolase (beta-lactamase superfamily II)